MNTRTMCIALQCTALNMVVLCENWTGLANTEKVEPKNLMYLLCVHSVKTCTQCARVPGMVSIFTQVLSVNISLVGLCNSIRIDIMP